MPVTQSQPPNGPLVDPKTGLITYEWLQWFTNRRGVEFYPFIDLTADYPALKRSLAILQARLADDSAYTDIEVLDEAYGSTWNGSVEVPTKNALYDYLNALPTLAHGTYNPTTTNTTNATSSSAEQSQYLRVGNTVVVSGRVSVQPTLGATATLIQVSLPITATFSQFSECGGSCINPGVAGDCAAIFANTTTMNANISWVSVDTSNHNRPFILAYLI